MSGISVCNWAQFSTIVDHWKRCNSQPVLVSIYGIYWMHIDIWHIGGAIASAVLRPVLLHYMTAVVTERLINLQMAVALCLA